MNYDILESEFELLSHYYVHFQTKAVEKSMNPLISTAKLKIVK